MSPELNQQALDLAYHSGWITVEQYHAAVAALQAMPHLSVIDLLHEQSIISEGQAEGLRQALATPVPAPEATHVEHAPVEPQAAQAPVEPHAAPAEHAAPAAEAHDPAPSVSVVSESRPVDPSKFPGGYTIDQLLRFGFDAGASDIHIGVSAAALMRKNGTFQPLYENAQVITADQTEALIPTFLNPMQLEYLAKHQALDFSYYVPGLARFRASVVRQRRGLDAVFRIINTKVRTMDELGLPAVMKVLTQYHNGLVLITGAVGSGKSTTLASMVQEVNTHRHDHIITLEDPVEYVFTPSGCQITQREVHTHTESFAAALRASLREDPDVIMVGEMRDLETISLAITASETGHLVMATLHTSNAARTLDRVLDAFPVEQQGQIRTMVSESLRGIVSQQLIPKMDGSGRVAAFEIMINTPAVANLIREAKTFQLPGIIQTGKKLGMKLMDDSLMELVEQKIITPHEAYDRCEIKKTFEPLLK
jgi:twitching motility protein PilT